jgi:hypothetical protein
MPSHDFYVELDSGIEVTVYVEVDITYDSDYGADADGNRGSDVYFIDDLRYIIPDRDDNDVELTAEDKKDLERILEDKIHGFDWCMYE